MSNEQPKAESARRKFLTGAAAATAGAATLGFPIIAKAQSPIVIKMQGSWGAHRGRCRRVVRGLQPLPV
jgi:hypothetical protein